MPEPVDLLDQAAQAANALSGGSCPGCDPCADSCGPCGACYACATDLREQIAQCCPCTTGGCLDFFDQGVDAAMPGLELIGSIAGCVASPCAFPLVFLFPADRHVGGGGDAATADGGGWVVSMLRAPLARPLCCCVACVLPPLGQYLVRLRALDGDMSRYSLFQGRFDGPHCLAACNPSLPFTLRAGSHGEQRCPQAYLCAEASCCTVCAFYASRGLMRDERGLGWDPTEVRVENCLFVFGQLASSCAACGCALQCVGCLLQCCAPPGELRDAGADCSRLGGACSRIAGAIFRGMWHVRNVAMACMSAQMVHESYAPLTQGAGARPHKGGGEDGGGGAGWTPQNSLAPPGCGAGAPPHAQYGGGAQQQPLHVQYGGQAGGYRGDPHYAQPVAQAYAPGAGDYYGGAGAVGIATAVHPQADARPPPPPYEQFQQRGGRDSPPPRANEISRV